jgi:hypothetical protein
MDIGQQVKICKWKAVFKLVPERIGVAQVKDLPNVKLVIDVTENEKYITSLEITTPDSSFVDAINYSELIANRCVDIISYRVGFGVSCSLSQINEIGSPRAVKTGAIIRLSDAMVTKMQNIDITTSSFSGVLQNKDERLARQLSHYRRGLSSSDISKKILEFYQVLEDEYYDGNRPFQQKYGYVRNLVTHPELTRNRTEIEKAEKLIGKPYFDPSSPQDSKAFEEQLHQIKCDAENVLKKKLSAEKNEAIETSKRDS